MENIVRDSQVEYVECEQETVEIIEQETDRLTEAIVTERTLEPTRSMKFPGLGGELIPYV